MTSGPAMVRAAQQRVAHVVRPAVAGGSVEVATLIRVAFLLFVISIPFESVTPRGADFALSKATGWLFFGSALLQPRVTFRRPAAPWWCFVLYLLAFSVIGLVVSGRHQTEFILRLVQQVQMLVLLWVSSNVLRDAKVARQTLLAFGTACLGAALMLRFGIAVSYNKWEGLMRTSFLRENENVLGVTFAIAILALIAPFYRRGGRRPGTYYLVFSAVAGLILALAIAGTGSRGATIALAVGVMALALFAKGRRLRLVGFVVALFFAGLTAYSIATTDTMRERLQRTLETGSSAGRGEIFEVSVDMVLERPITGWGPVNHVYEVGKRVGAVRRDTHNTAMWVLTETGLVGGLWFLLGLGWCVASGWRARDRLHGPVPLAMVLVYVVSGFGGTEHNRKLFWIVMGFALAARALGKAAESTDDVRAAARTIRRAAPRS